MNLINNELFKLHMKKRLLPFFILNFIADVLLISFVLIKKDSIFYSLINGQNFPLFSLEITLVFSIVFSCMSVYDLFIYEDKSGTLCTELLTPLNRKEVVLSKFFAIMLELGVFFVVNLIFSYTISSVFLQFGDVFSYCGVFLPFKDGLLKTIVSYILIFFPLSGVTSFAILLYFLISKKIKSPGFLFFMVLSVSLMGLFELIVSNRSFPVLAYGSYRNIFHYFVLNMTSKTIIEVLFFTVITVFFLFLSVSIFKQREFNA